VVAGVTVILDELVAEPVGATGVVKVTKAFHWA
jgi:hypothetical protein